MAATTDPITEFYAKKGRYPANNQQWWMARSEIDDPDTGVKVGDFLPDLLDKLFLGNMRAPKGHFIIEAFQKDRSTISGVSGIADEPTKERPTTVTFFSGRSWFGCNSTVYFSQILVDKSNAAKCYMEADPTSEYLPDPVATDGGVIEIPEANKIIRLVPHAGGVLVFARNGVWYITGTQAGFSALDISVNKVSPIGTNAPMSIVETDTAVFWWSDVGIMGIAQQNGTFGPTGAFDKTNVSETTVQSFYNDISSDIRAKCKGLYDPQSNTIYWMFRDDDVSETQYNKILCLDLTLNAFYPWKISGTSPVIKGLYSSTKLNTYTVPTDIKPSSVEFVVANGTTLRIAQARNGSFVDWETYDNVGVTYDSYMEAGFELFDDAMRDKNITYLFAYLTRTETSADEDGVPDYPSSCMLQIKWDWASGSQSNKWTSAVEVYRPTQLLLDNPDTGFGMVVTKNKVRGNGKSIQFRFSNSEAGKDFDLNGWAIEVSGNVTP